MPQENGSNPPSGNPDGQPFGQDPRTNLPEQGVMSNEPTTRSYQEEEDSQKPTGRVHWINHATFYLSIILAILTAGTIRVYYLQLNQMIIATKATQNAAYDACMSAKIARQTLLEYEAGEADSHSAASGTVAQASIAIRDESGFLSMGTTRPFVMPPLAGQDQASLEEAAKTWKSIDVYFSYNDIGKSGLTNVLIKFTVQLLPHGYEPRVTDKNVYHDTAKGNVNPNQPVLTRPNIIDKDNHFIDRKTVNMDDFNSGQTYIASFGRADYVDVFGVHHWQTFCGTFDNYPFDPTSSTQLRHEACAAYNQQDSNLLYPLPQYTQPKISPSAIDEIVCKAPTN